MMSAEDIASRPLLEVMAALELEDRGDLQKAIDGLARRAQVAHISGDAASFAVAEIATKRIEAVLAGAA